MAQYQLIMESEGDTGGLCRHKGYSGLYYYNPDDSYFRSIVKLSTEISSVLKLVESVEVRYHQSDPYLQPPLPPVYLPSS